MEPITATLKTAKEVYDTIKTIEKVYNVSKEMKTVAESEGKDQIEATKNFAGTVASEMKQDSKTEKSESKSNNNSNDAGIKGDLHHDNRSEASSQKGNFVDEFRPVFHEGTVSTTPTDFVEKLPVKETSKPIQFESDVFVDKLPYKDSQKDSLFLEQNNNINSKEPLIDKIDNEANIKEPLNPEISESNDGIDSSAEKKQEGLTDAEKQEIKDKTGWSDKIVDAIRTKEEAQIYIDAGLVEGEINGKPALLQPNIDGKACNEPKWPNWSNKDLAEEGYPPRDNSGRPYELHHIGQNPNAPLAELTYEQHHSGGNFKILHTFDESSIDRTQFGKERKDYWSERSKSL